MDIGALLEANNTVVEPIFYMMTNTDSYIANVGTISADGESHYLLSPAGACFVQAIDSVKDIALTITPDMFATSTGVYGGDPAAAPAPKRVGRVQTDRRRLHIAASDGTYTAYAAVVESVEAHDIYTSSEDAEVMLLDNERTPFAIYTLAEMHALAINQVHGMARIPLCQYAAPNYGKDTLSLTFYGDDEYVREWDLVDSWQGKRWHLSEQPQILAAIPQDGRRRYYLEHYYEVSEPSDETEAEFAMSYYILDGEVVIFANQDMNDFQIYDPLGKVVYAHSTSAQIVKVWLPAGSYIVRTNNSVLKIVNSH